MRLSTSGLLLALSLLMQVGICAAEDVLRVAYFNYPPHITTDKNGKPYGPLVDVWEQHMVKHGGFKIKWVGPIPFVRLLSDMKTGEQADVWAQLVGNKERFEWYDFPPAQICEARQWLYVRADEPLAVITGVEDLTGKTLGKLTGGYLPPFMDENKDKLSFEEVAGDNAAEQTVKKLIGGRIWGGYFVMSEVLKYAASKIGRSDEIKGLAFPGGEKTIACSPAMWRGLDPAMRARVADAADKSWSSKEYNYLEMTDEFIKNAPSHVGR